MDHLEDTSLILNPFEYDFDLSSYKKYIIDLCSNYKVDDKKRYQIVVMAAGKGSRMNLNYPKPLFKINYPNGKKTLLKNLLDVIEEAIPNVSKINIAINSIDRDYFEDLKDRNNMIEILELNDSQIKGTAVCLDAIKDSLSDKDDIILFWGDLAITRSSYIFYSILLHEKYESSITMPTRYKKDPYVGFIRGNFGKFIKVFHSNEAEQYIGWAEQDCLSFILKKEVLSVLPEFIKNEKNKGKEEIDFVSFIPFCNVKNNILGIPFADYKNVSGINNKDKAKKIEQYLENMSSAKYEDKFLNKYSL
tara:strand:+ start:3289 stop:4203 length:915 start_codon:yes stop_codon:yes gene_type:complete